MSICLNILISTCLNICMYNFSEYLDVYLSLCLNDLDVYLSEYLSKYQVVYSSICLNIWTAICVLSKYFNVYLFLCLGSMFPDFSVLTRTYFKLFLRFHSSCHFSLVEDVKKKHYYGNYFFKDFLFLQVVSKIFISVHTAHIFY